jgi:hopanoid biosynthesis associated protein HpnK
MAHPAPSPRGVIVTADDFGASLSVNDAVEIAHRDGILTAASLMVAGDAADDAVERALAMPSLGVGLHLVLVEGRPVLPPETIPDLVDVDGRFRTNMVRTALAIALKPAARRQLRSEITAQFDAFAATGLPLDHINAHKHFHLHPMIADAVIDIGRRYGMKAVRAPVKTGTPGIEHWWAARLQRRLRQEGLLVADQVVGLAWTGAFDTARMREALDALPPGLTEIYTHPATTDDWSGAAPGYRYRDELAALTDVLAMASIQRDGVVHGSFSRFTDAP